MRVLMVGHAGTGTGLSRVLHRIAGSLADWYEIRLLGINYFGPELPGRLHILPNPNRSDRYAIVEMLRLIDEWQPEILFIHEDCFRLAFYLDRLGERAEKLKIVMYCAPEGDICEPELARILDRVDMLVLPTQFAEAGYRSAAAKVCRPGYASRLAVIPHGVDNEAFRPADRLAARRHILPGDPSAWDGFWLLNANCHQPRKQISTTIEGFALFARDKPAGVRLWLHMQQRCYGEDVLRTAFEQGIRERVHISGFSGKVADEELNKIYNACDAGINTSSGEGWGLVAFEHGATGAAQILPRHSACRELWEGHALFLETKQAEREPGDFLSRAYTSPAAVAETLERLYADKILQREMGERAQQNYLRPEFCWSAVGRQWRRLFQSLHGPAEYPLSSRENYTVNNQTFNILTPMPAKNTEPAHESGIVHTPGS